MIRVEVGVGVMDWVGVGVGVVDWVMKKSNLAASKVRVVERVVEIDVEICA